MAENLRDKFVGIPFESQGRDYSGCDCWGLVWLWYRDVLGVHLQTFEDVQACKLREVSTLITKHKSEWDSVGAPGNNDVVLMRTMNGDRSRLVAHVGLVVNRNMVLHIEQPYGSRLERIDAPHVRSRIMEYRRYAGCRFEGVHSDTG